MALSDVAIRGAKPRSKAYKLHDEAGLFLAVQPSGSKLWRLRYRFDGREKLLSLGTYPTASLSVARARRDEARALLARGIDPSAQRRAERARADGLDSFRVVAREWLEHEAARKAWSPKHHRIVAHRIESNLCPALGALPLDEIDAPRLLEVLRSIAKRSPIIASRMRQASEGIFRLGIASGRASRNPAVDLRGLVSRPKPVTHRAAIVEPTAIGELMRRIDAYGSFLTKRALRLLAYTFVRPGELQRAQWGELELDAECGPVWRIPAERMKQRAPHLVPLASQAVAIVEELRPHTFHRSEFLFPSERSALRPMSENTLNAALRTMGYSKTELCAHGFRRMASTRLNESQKWHRDAIERQLAHGERDAVRAAYNAAEHLTERRRMMAWWADCLDGLRDGGTVLPFRKPAS